MSELSSVRRSCVQFREALLEIGDEVSRILEADVNPDVSIVGRAGEMAQVAGTWTMSVASPQGAMAST